MEIFLLKYQYRQNTVHNFESILPTYPTTLVEEDIVSAPHQTDNV